VLLYLASASPARLALLKQAGFDPVVRPSSVDEKAAVDGYEAEHGPLAPDAFVQYLGRLKAENVAASLSDQSGFVLGGDSAFLLDGTLYGKPGSPEIAKQRWLAHRGRSGVLYSGHWLIDLDSGRACGAVARATVEFAGDLDDAELDAYIATGEPLAVAGAFTIDGLAAPFIRSIEGAPSTVVGLSLPALRDSFAELGVNWSDILSAR